MTPAGFWPALLPQFFLTGSLLGVLSLGLGSGFSPRARAAARLLAFLGPAGGLAALALGRWGYPPSELLRADGASLAWQGLFLAAALPLAGLLPAESELPLALLMGALLGLSLMAVANHLFLLFMGLEMMSLSIYMLLYASRPDARALEAAMKYFFSGAAAAGLYLLGFAAYYASTGQMSLGPSGPLAPGAAAGIFLMASAALFKIGAFPLHFWLPDAYEAAAPELAGFMSTAVKAGGFLLLARLMSLVPRGSGESLAACLPWIAALTMTLGNLLALRQENLQRMLAYSSISHAGAMLAAVWASLKTPGSGNGTLVLYLLAYLFMSTGAFLSLRLAGASTLDELRGLGARSPGLAAFLALMLLSLAGVPPTAGFLAKLLVFLDVFAARGWWLAAALAVNSAVAMGYYLSILKAVAFEPAGEAFSGEAEFPRTARATLWACSAAVVAIGFWPGLKAWLDMFLTG